jgi:dTDP-4-amino-4,6-dideoxygalactose transaminase
MNVPLIDLTTQFDGIQDDLREALDRVVSSRCFILGPEVEALEREIAAYCGVTNGIGVSSGSDALVTSLIALGIGPGHEVIVPAFTFFATAGSVARVGARPVFVDIEAGTFNMNPEALARVITKRTRAIIPVHLYGQCADMDAIGQVADARGIPVIEDAAQVIGATYKDRSACSMGKLGIVSFYPTKNLSGIGEAGMVLTDDETFAERLRSIRNHGQTGIYEHEWIGGNHRMDAIQAAVLRLKLPKLDQWTEMKRAIAARYDEALTDSCVIPPVVREDCRHVYSLYTVRCKRRDDLRKHLAEAGIGAGIYYPMPLHLQPCFAYLGHTCGDFPVAEQACTQVLSLPVFAGMSTEQQDYVIDTVRAFDKAA